MPPYKKSTREAVGDMKRGLVVRTTENLEATDYWLTADTTTIFTVVGRIRLMGLYALITENMAGAAQPNFAYVSTTPVITKADICAVPASVATKVVGDSVAWLGATVATVCGIAGPPQMAICPGANFILGGVAADGTNFIGGITADGSVADATDGNITFYCEYAPMSDGAYVQAAV